MRSKNRLFSYCDCPCHKIVVQTGTIIYLGESLGSRAVIKADGWSSCDSICTCSISVVLTLKLYIHCTVILLVYFKILAFNPIKHTTGSRLAVSGEWTGWPDQCFFFSKTITAFWFHHDMVCGSSLRPCVLEGAQTYDSENLCPGDLAVSPFSFYYFRSVLSLDIFLEHVVSRYQIPKEQKMMALSPNNHALVSPVFTYSYRY